MEKAKNSEIVGNELDADLLDCLSISGQVDIHRSIDPFKNLFPDTDNSLVAVLSMSKRYKLSPKNIVSIFQDVAEQTCQTTEHFEELDDVSRQVEVDINEPNRGQYKWRIARKTLLTSEPVALVDGWGETTHNSDQFSQRASAVEDICLYLLEGAVERYSQMSPYNLVEIAQQIKPLTDYIEHMNEMADSANFSIRQKPSILDQTNLTAEKYIYRQDYHHKWSWEA